MGNIKWTWILLKLKEKNAPNTLIKNAERCKTILEEHYPESEEIRAENEKIVTSDMSDIDKLNSLDCSACEIHAGKSIYFSQWCESCKIGKQLGSCVNLNSWFSELCEWFYTHEDL